MFEVQVRDVQHAQHPELTDEENLLLLPAHPQQNQQLLRLLVPRRQVLLPHHEYHVQRVEVLQRLFKLVVRISLVNEI